jgi:FdhE protein
MKRSKWDQRIQRADELISSHPFAAEVLRFYKGVVAFQKEFYAYVGAARGNGSQKATALVGAFSPAPVANCVANLRTQPARFQDLLTFRWRQAANSQVVSGDTEGLLAWIFLQPYAEFLADRSEHNPGNDGVGLCPFCGGKPLVGVLRPEGDGAKRFLICGLCSTEWAFRRILCASCGEEAVEKLAVYTANEFNHVRVEGCDTCQHYIKTVDLTKNGLAVPVVDELATIPLNLWAQEHGYTKLQPNLLGI